MVYDDKLYVKGEGSSEISFKYNKFTCSFSVNVYKESTAKNIIFSALKDISLGKRLRFGAYYIG